MRVEKQALTPAQRQAAEAYLRSGGCIREPDGMRRPEGPNLYKKGWEVRIYVTSKAHALATRAVLQRAGLKPGRAYQNSPNRWVLPLYGRDPVQRYLAWVDALSSRAG